MIVIKSHVHAFNDNWTFAVEFVQLNVFADTIITESVTEFVANCVTKFVTNSVTASVVIIAILVVEIVVIVEIAVAFIIISGTLFKEHLFKKSEPSLFFFEKTVFFCERGCVFFQ